MICEDEFGTKLDLMLQHLTYPGMKHYITSTLGSFLAFKELPILDGGLTSALIKNIADRSSGVFPRVVLVVSLWSKGWKMGIVCQICKLDWITCHRNQRISSEERCIISTPAALHKPLRSSGSFMHPSVHLLLSAYS